MKKRTFRTRKNQAGLGLIELMIALGIAMVIAAVSLGIAAQVRADNRVSQLQTQVIHVATQAQALANGTNYAGIDTEVLIDGKKVPDSWVTDTDITHPFRGTITVNGAASGLTVTVAGIPAGACHTLLTNTIANFQSASVGSAADDDAFTSASTPAEISTACNDGTGDKTVNILV